MTPTLLERIAARRSDHTFLGRLRKIVTRDRELLDRLAGE
jgi:hypothetical protein